MDFLDDMGVSKLSAKVFSKVNYSFKKCLLMLKTVVLLNILGGNHDRSC